MKSGTFATPQLFRVLRGILMGAVGIPTLGLIYLSSQGEVNWITAAGYLSFGILAYMCLYVIWVSTLSLRISFLISLISVSVVAPEVTLRIVGFRNESAVSYGALRPEHKSYFVPDKNLFWKHSPESQGINSLGFRGNEVNAPKPKNTKRILFLGDSCTDQDYAQFVEAILNRQYGGDSISYECVILAAPGYSSYQGKELAHKYATALEADLAFVYFGWNDHWLAYGATDSELEHSEIQHLANQLYHASRLLQLGRKLFFTKKASSADTRVIDKVRVPMDDFDSNMKDICSTFTENHIPVVLVTPPSSHELRGVPEYLVEKRLAKDKNSVLKLHESYCRAIRRIAKQSDVYLLDLAQELGNLERIDEIFLSDGIHFTELGKQLVGYRILEFIKEENFHITESNLPRER